MPIVLYDEQGSPVEVPEGEIQQALSGGLGFAPGQRLKLRSPDGETYEQGPPTQSRASASGGRSRPRRREPSARRKPRRAGWAGR